MLNHGDYENMILDILQNTTKFKKIDSDPTLYREGKFLLKEEKGVIEK